MSPKLHVARRRLARTCSKASKKKSTVYNLEVCKFVNWLIGEFVNLVRVLIVVWGWAFLGESPSCSLAVWGVNATE